MEVRSRAHNLYPLLAGFIHSASVQLHAACLPAKPLYDRRKISARVLGRDPATVAHHELRQPMI